MRNLHEIALEFCDSFDVSYKHLKRIEDGLRQVRNEALEEAQDQYLNHDYDMAYARVCSLVHGGNPDEQVVASQASTQSGEK